MQKVVRAHHVYETLGFSIWPWEIDTAIPSDWMDAIEAFAYKLPAEIEKRKNKAAKRK